MASEMDSNHLSSTLKRSQHDCSQTMKEILWKLAYKHLKSNDWRRLATHWKFTDDHIRAIEHQYTGKLDIDPDPDPDPDLGPDPDPDPDTDTDITWTLKCVQRMNVCIVLFTVTNIFAHPIELFAKIA